MPSGREPESHSSGDCGGTPLRQLMHSDHDAGARMLTIVSEKTPDASPPPMGQAFGERSDRRSENSMETLLSPSKERINSTCETREFDIKDIDDFTCLSARNALTVEPVTPQRCQAGNRHTSALKKHGLLSTTSPILPRESFRHDCLDVASIDTSVLCTPQNRGCAVAPTTSARSERSRPTRLPIRREGSVSPSPRRRRAGVWRTYKAKGGIHD